MLVFLGNWYVILVGSNLFFHLLGDNNRAYTDASGTWISCTRYGKYADRSSSH